MSEDEIKRTQSDFNMVSFREAVDKAEFEKINLCLQCGVCTASCPSGRKTAFRTRQTIRKVILGFSEKVLADSNLWLCTTCYTCVERCPRGVDPAEVILALRRLAVKAGYMLARHKSVSILVLKYGHAVPIDEANRRVRTELGLSELPPTTHMFEGALREVQIIAEKTGFCKLVGFEAR